MSAIKNIALMRPKLPRHEAILPYWHEIDANRWYSNFGPLSLRLEKRIAEFFKHEDGSVVTVSNGTAGLTNILRALNLPRNSYCLLPSWTFIATPASIISAGLIPYFIDVDEKTWALNPQTVREHLLALGDKVGAVMVVAPYGAPLDTKAWDLLTEETGIQVIIDAAAGFDAFSTVECSRPRKSAVMISLHATKALGIGEGGLVISSNTALISRVREMSNFGFCGSRIVSTPGTNGKMSEYHAAIGHAALDEWQTKRNAFDTVKTYYVTALKKAGIAVYAPSLESEWTNSTLNVRLPENAANATISMLNNAGIESRKWWGNGCHTHPAYVPYPRADLTNTERLCESVIALPFYVDMTDKEVTRVVAALEDILHQVGKARQKAYA